MSLRFFIFFLFDMLSWPNVLQFCHLLPLCLIPFVPTLLTPLSACIIQKGKRLTQRPFSISPAALGKGRAIVLYGQGVCDMPTRLNSVHALSKHAKLAKNQSSLLEKKNVMNIISQRCTRKDNRQRMIQKAPCWIGYCDTEIRWLFRPGHLRPIILLYWI